MNFGEYLVKNVTILFIYPNVCGFGALSNAVVPTSCKLMIQRQLFLSLVYWHLVESK